MRGHAQPVEVTSRRGDVSWKARQRQNLDERFGPTVFDTANTVPFPGKGSVSDSL